MTLTTAQEHLHPRSTCTAVQVCYMICLHDSAAELSLRSDSCTGSKTIKLRMTTPGPVFHQGKPATARPAVFLAAVVLASTLRSAIPQSEMHSLTEPYNFLWLPKPRLRDKRLLESKHQRSQRVVHCCCTPPSYLACMLSGDAQLHFAPQRRRL